MEFNEKFFNTIKKKFHKIMKSFRNHIDKIVNMGYIVKSKTNWLFTVYACDW